MLYTIWKVCVFGFQKIYVNSSEYVYFVIALQSKGLCLVRKVSFKRF